MKKLALALLLFAGAALADTGIDFVLVGSDSLGYERSGFGLQLDTDGRVGDWGWDGQFTAVRHAKLGGEGYRIQAVATGRYFHGNLFVEAGAEYGGYDTDFPDGRNWTKYGYAPVVGIGAYAQRYEVTVRYFLEDSTFNNTTVFQVAGEIPLNQSIVLGASLEQWSFNQGGDRLKGNQFTVELGWRW